MRPFLALALPAMVLSASAFAQSSVTLYGSIDNGITYVNNVAGSSSIRMQDGANKSNTLGFLGSEDLGGGQKALFKLENGFSANTGALGQGGLMFGKQAYVGLSDNRIGQVTLGRQYDFTVVLEHYLPCLQCGLFVVENADFDRISGDRLNNSVQFQSRDFGGLKIGTMYAFAQNATGSTNSGRAYSFMAEYTNGAVWRNRRGNGHQRRSGPRKPAGNQIISRGSGWAAGLGDCRRQPAHSRCGRVLLFWRTAHERGLCQHAT